MSNNPNDKLEENNEQSLEFIDDEEDDSQSNDSESFNDNYSLYDRSMNTSFNV